MKKFILGLFVLTSLSLTTACSSDDDNDGGSQSGELTVTIDGQAITFNSIIVDEDIYTEDGVTYTELDVTATVSGNTNRIVEFGLESGDTGADALYYFYYTVDGEEYYYNYDGGFNAVVSVNNGSSLAMTFSGSLTGGEYNQETGEYNTITFQNGSISVNY